MLQLLRPVLKAASKLPGGQPVERVYQAPGLLRQRIEQPLAASEKLLWGCREQRREGEDEGPGRAQPQAERGGQRIKVGLPKPAR